MTQTDIKSLYNDYNSEFFNSALPDITIKLETRKTTRIYGQYRASKRWGIVKRMIRIFPIAITSGNVEETLFHEMTHYYLHYTGKPCGHTKTFKAIMSKFLGHTVKNRYVQKTKKPRTITPTLEGLFPIPTEYSPVSAPERHVDPSKLSIGDTYQGEKIISLETKGGVRIAFKLEYKGWVKL